MKVLVTGGAGYIGSTVSSACLDAGHDVVILDDLSTGRRNFARALPFYEGDVADSRLLARVWTEHEIDVVVHCAARIVVPESISDPLAYYDNNVGRTISFLRHLITTDTRRVVFSSSASVYDASEDFVVDEHSPVVPQSPYAQTKLMVEQVLSDVCAGGRLRAVALRYFNPIGSDPLLRTGQQIEQPSHLMGKLLEARDTGRPFTITGADWPTRDGSGIRDFIHVWDLARAHVAAIERFDSATSDQPYQVINLGTGKGVTVKELVDAFITGTGSNLDVRIGPRRPGDVVGVYTRTDKAHRLLGWRAELSQADAVRDAVAWLPRRQTILGY
ncbi:UDP-glucose 4-epimerase GalE [Microlunatus sp. Y2014]|uniref:UDP-glucose 4-epimerase GalE n=1 Tax=Microlunatus sp. Y2014 TaxID=3418488 RepID=UPI003DA726C9